jgi:hypothetical protein
MWIRKDWFAVTLLLTATVGLNVAFTACTRGPNSSEKALVGFWEHEDEPPNVSEHQYSFNGDHTFTLKGAKETGGKVEFTVTGTWSAAPKILCIRFVSCTGPGCPSPQGTGVDGLGLSVCNPYRLSGTTLTIIDGRGSTNATDYEVSTPWNRANLSPVGEQPGAQNLSPSGQPPNMPNAADKALSDSLVGGWTHRDNPPGSSTSQFSFNRNLTFSTSHTTTNDKGEEEEKNGAGTWNVTDNRLCLYMTSSCTGRGCAPTPDDTVKEPICTSFDVRGGTLTFDDGGEPLRFMRQ